MAFCKEYNAATQDKVGTVIPVEITVFEVTFAHGCHAQDLHMLNNYGAAWHFSTCTAVVQMVVYYQKACIEGQVASSMLVGNFMSSISRCMFDLQCMLTACCVKIRSYVTLKSALCMHSTHVLSAGTKLEVAEWLQDRSFTFILKTPPASVLLAKAAGVPKGSGAPNTQKVGKISQAQLKVRPALKSQLQTASQIWIVLCLHTA